jgi:hypothetical protein
MIEAKQTKLRRHAQTKLYRYLGSRQPRQPVRESISHSHDVLYRATQKSVKQKYSLAVTEVKIYINAGV